MTDLAVPKTIQPQGLAPLELIWDRDEQNGRIVVGIHDPVARMSYQVERIAVSEKTGESTYVAIIGDEHRQITFTIQERTPENAGVFATRHEIFIAKNKEGDRVLVRREDHFDKVQGYSVMGAVMAALEAPAAEAPKEAQAASLKVATLQEPQPTLTVNETPLEHGALLSVGSLEPSDAIHIASVLEPTPAVAARPVVASAATAGLGDGHGTVDALKAAKKSKLVSVATPTTGAIPGFGPTHAALPGRHAHDPMVEMGADVDASRVTIAERDRASGGPIDFDDETTAPEANAGTLAAGHGGASVESAHGHEVRFDPMQDRMGEVPDRDARRLARSMAFDEEPTERVANDVTIDLGGGGRVVAQRGTPMTVTATPGGSVTDGNVMGAAAVFGGEPIGNYESMLGKVAIPPAGYMPFTSLVNPRSVVADLLHVARVDLDQGKWGGSRQGGGGHPGQQPHDEPDAQGQA